MLVRGNTTRFSVVYQNVTDSSGNTTQTAKKTASLHEIARSQMKRVKTAINSLANGQPYST